MGQLTRRELAAVLATSTVVLAQAPPANDETAASIAQNREMAGELDKFPLPMTAEPATIFRP
jgi:hypothetical protein